MADTDYYYHRDAASRTDETERMDVDELLVLLEQKDSDLRKAAELGESSVVLRITALLPADDGSK